MGEREKKNIYLDVSNFETSLSKCLSRNTFSPFSCQRFHFIQCPCRLYTRYSIPHFSHEVGWQEFKPRHWETYIFLCSAPYCKILMNTDRWKSYKVIYQIVQISVQKFLTLLKNFHWRLMHKIPIFKGILSNRSL